MCTIELETKEGYETRSLLGNFFYHFFLQPILNHLPARTQAKVKKSHVFADEVITHKTSHRALDVIYSDKYAGLGDTIRQDIAYWVWRNTDNVIGVRNRLRLVKREITSKLCELNTDDTRKGEVYRILSIASGSSRSFLEVLATFKCNHQTEIHVTFLDKSLEALDYSKELYEQYKHTYCDCFKFYWQQGNANAYLRSLHQEITFDIVEMVGLLDYFDDEKFTSTLSEIRSHLKVGGTLLTGNILHNKEERFISNVVDWRMIYRHPHQLCELTKQAGFKEDVINIYIEPLGVHALVRGIKT